MDTSRGVESLTNEDWTVYLKSKYANERFDAIIADSDAAASLLLEYPDLFGSIPNILFSEDQISASPHQHTLVPAFRTSARSTARLALEQNPDAQTAIIIHTTYPTYEVFLENLTAELRSADVRVEMRQQFELSALAGELSSLGDDTIVFYFPVFSDSAGVDFIPREALTMLAAESAVPVYTFWSTMLGSGTVGGVMIDPEQTASALIDQIFSYRETGTFSRDSQTYGSFLDWQALTRHNIDTRSIPPEVTIVNRPERFIVTYITEFVSFVAVVMSLVVAIIAALLVRDRKLNRDLQATGRALKRVVDAKQTLYEEMNHRIKNNLMILGSLVDLQVAQVDDDAVRRPLEDVSSRLHTLALVHDSLYSSDQTAGVDVGQFLTSLVNQIGSGMVGGNGPSVQLDVEEILFDAKIAVSCGMLVNELLTNAIKYAFPADKAGDIRIALRRRGDNEAELSVRDNGRGLPDQFDIATDGGLGMTIVHSLVQQLDGELTVTTQAGTSFVIRFPA